MAESIELTSEERACVAQAVAADARFLPTLASYLPYLAPVALFGGYGVAIGDVTAVALAFVCLLGLNLWWIQSQGRVTAVFRSICVKLDAAADRSKPGGR